MAARALSWPMSSFTILYVADELGMPEAGHKMRRLHEPVSAARAVRSCFPFQRGRDGVSGPVGRAGTHRHHERRWRWCVAHGARRTTHVVRHADGRLRRLVREELEVLNGFARGLTDIAGITPAKRGFLKRGFLMGNALVTRLVTVIGRALWQAQT